MFYFFNFLGLKENAIAKAAMMNSISVLKVHGENGLLKMKSEKIFTIEVSLK